MKKRALTLSILTALCSVPLIAAAHPRAGGGPERFDELDADKNGSVSQSEMQTAMTRHVSEPDTNKDGRVTQQEAEAFHAGKRAEHGEQRFTESDANHDGKLSKQELSKLPGDMFERLDLDGDGFVTKAEMQEAHAAMKDRHG